MTIDKNFDPAAIEAKWYAHWESTNAFRPDRPDAEPYTIVNPPPNVTGSLHIGHALDNTLQDILIRHARLQGKDALWVVGTDHAGIATQMVVERQLNEKQDKRTNYTRDEFVAKVWEWKEESGGEITRQLRRLGCSMDWANERFTMDEGFSKAVIKVFVDLYNQGLLYRDKRLVNWDPGLKTAISDLEVETREVNGKFWHLRYPLADGSGHISVATTRPETMLADMAVAVSADDARYTALIGKQIKLPITGRLIPIVADEHADPELGSGAVKVTPGHDFNDFEVGKRAGFKAGEMLNMLDAEAKVVQTSDGLIPDALLGLSVADARKEVVALLEAAGLLEKVEDRVIQTPFGDRSGVVIEPWLTDQWYVDAETLAKPAIDAVRNGDIKVVPKSWEKTYFNWMENIQPWCVSRQLWWGHRIPAWFGYPVWGADFRLLKPDQIGDPSSPLPTFVAENEEDAISSAERFYRENWDLEGKSFSVVVGDEAGLNVNGDKVTASIRRDDDVLDTWFSSALWPFGTLGWPDQTTELDRHYPNDVLVSGFDILFFWDARMAMQGIHFMKEVPWKTLYLHGLVRAADGSKMSKSKGNTVDPLGLIDQYGADALRFFMAAMESQGRDIKMDQSRVEGYRNFATKLWNAARFAQGNGIGASQTLAAPKAELAVNRWIIGETVETLDTLNKAFAEFRFDGMADTIYHFVWDQFCDWYLELIKPAFIDGEKQDMDDESKTVAGWVLDQILVMLHPFMPFITEELWHALGERKYDLIHAKWPEPKASVDAEAASDIKRIVELVSDIRTQRTEIGVSPAARLGTAVYGDSGGELDWLNRNKDYVTRLGRVQPILARVEPSITMPNVLSDVWNSDDSEDFHMVQGEIRVWSTTLQIPSGGLTLVASLEGLVDLDAERTRIGKALEAAAKERDSLGGRLNNAAFVEKAKPEAVEKARADHAEKSAEVERLTAALARLG